MLGDNVRDILVIDIATGNTFDFQLCNDCEYEFEYPDMDAYNADESNHVTELGV
jgi:hypothetical protein